MKKTDAEHNLHLVPVQNYSYPSAKKATVPKKSYRKPIPKTIPEKYKFIPGLALNRAFFQEVVKPLLKDYFPNLKYAAGLVGHGSDVLGFDTAESMDHNWGPRCRVVLKDEEFLEKSKIIDKFLRYKLPFSYKGFPTNFTMDTGYLERQMKLTKKYPINHSFRFYSMHSYFIHYLSDFKKIDSAIFQHEVKEFDPYKELDFRDWLILPEQILLETTAGEVFHDEIGFQKMREKFAYYPDDVWYYIMGVQWGRIVADMGFHGRAGLAKDEVGSKILAGTMIRHIMRICFYMERTYAPYRKWFSKAFEQLPCAFDLMPLINEIMQSNDWRSRQDLFAKCYEILRNMHNTLGITKPMDMQIVDFNGRGFPSMDFGPMLIEVGKCIKNKELADLKYKLGAIDQFVDHTQVHFLDSAHLAFRAVIK